MSIRYLNKTHQAVLMGLCLAILLSVGVSGVIVLRPSPPPEPGGDLVGIVRFVNSSRYQRLPETDKLAYMKRLRQSADELRAAQRAGTITLEQYQEAHLNGWMARQIERMDEYYSLAEATRDQQLRAKYVAAGNAASKPVDPSEPSDDMQDDFIKNHVRTWPIEQREKWDRYRAAVKAAKSAAKTRAGSTRR